MQLQSPQIAINELNQLLDRTNTNLDERAVVVRELADRIPEIAAVITNSEIPETAAQALRLLINLTDGSEIMSAKLWSNLADTGCAAVISAAKNREQADVARQALHLLSQLAGGSQDTTAALWLSLGESGRASVITAATTAEQPAVAEMALALLANFAADNDTNKAELWASLSATQRIALVTMAIKPGQTEVAEQALSLLANLASGAGAIRVELWGSLGDSGRAVIVAAATTPEASEVVKLALRLLTNLTYGSETRTSQLWASLGPTERASVIALATNQELAATAIQAQYLLVNLAGSSVARTNELWTSLGATERAALITAATTADQPNMAMSALHLLINLCFNSVARKAELWTSLLGTALTALVTAATTPAQPEVAELALRLLRLLQPAANEAVWILLQPRLANLWTMTQVPTTAQISNQFLFEQIRGNVDKTRQTFNALNAVSPSIAARKIALKINEWRQVNAGQAGMQEALLNAILQTDSSSQRMGVLLAITTNWFHVKVTPQNQRETIFNYFLTLSDAAGIDRNRYKNRLALMFDTVLTNVSAALNTPGLKDLEKLELIEHIYIFPGFLTANETQAQLTNVLFAPAISRDLKISVLGLILKHGQANTAQFHTLLNWLRGEFKKEKYTVFTDFGGTESTNVEEVESVLSQRHQYLMLYRDFKKHMTVDFIKAEIADINQQILIKKIPSDFGDILKYQLQNFLETLVSTSTSTSTTSSSSSSPTPSPSSVRNTPIRYDEKRQSF
ncbi:hypothetical protein [Polaromonas vacuolata]|uniref:hypothetical protein n=1 Tax=Polaromonas vacuolata TaxID=37448 RepID=UPI001456F725|nr:hypothetical protein [Polaromonas vacuolata]